MSLFIYRFLQGGVAKMNSVPISSLDEKAKQALEQSSAIPKMYVIIRGNDFVESIQAVQYKLEFGVQSGNNVNQKTVHKRYSELEEFDKLIRKYFKDQKLIGPFPPKKLLGNTDEEFLSQRQIDLQRYLTQIFKVPGICIFPPFLNLFGIEAELFVQA